MLRRGITPDGANRTFIGSSSAAVQFLAVRKITIEQTIDGKNDGIEDLVQAGTKHCRLPGLIGDGHQSCLWRIQDHAGACRNTIIKIDHLIIYQPRTSVRNTPPKCGRVVGPVDPKKRIATFGREQIERPRPERVIQLAGIVRLNPSGRPCLPLCFGAEAKLLVCLTIAKQKAVIRAGPGVNILPCYTADPNPSLMRLNGRPFCDPKFDIRAHTGRKRNG